MSCEKRRRQRPGHGDPPALEARDVARTPGDNHRAVIVTHAGAARTEGVLIGDEGIAVQADGGQFEFAAKRPMVERFDVLQGVFETIAPGGNLVVGQGMEHEGVVRIGTVAHADQPSVGSDCRHGFRFEFERFICRT